MRLKLLGYWRSGKELIKPYNPDTMINKGQVVDDDFWRDDSENKYPWPGDLVDNDYWKKNPVIKDSVIHYLRSGRPCNHYRGYSHCRLCGTSLSSFERTDGTWIWPDQFEHYLIEHNIMVPLPFIEQIIIQPEIRFSIEEHKSDLEKDETYWISWSKQFSRTKNEL